MSSHDGRTPPGPGGPHGWPPPQPQQELQPQQPGWGPPMQQSPQNPWPAQTPPQNAWPQQQGWPQQPQQPQQPPVQPYAPAPQQFQQAQPPGPAAWGPPPQGQPFGAPAPFGAPGASAARAFANPPIVARGKKDGSPRVGGAALFGAGLLLAGLNVYTITNENKFYPKALLLAPFALLTGLWLLVVGAPTDPNTGEQALWSRIGTGITAGVGIVIGIVALVFVGC